MLTTLPSLPSTKSFRHPVQHFVWARQSWDIARLLCDIDCGKLRPRKLVLEREFLRGYAEQVLAQDQTRDRTEQRLSLLMRVDTVAALALPAQALEEPVVLLHAGKGKGLLMLEGHTSADHVLGDGQHRVTKAYHEDIQSLSAYVLSAAQSRSYRLD